jgi:hypothetical protein
MDYSPEALPLLLELSTAKTYHIKKFFMTAGFSKAFSLRPHHP